MAISVATRPLGQLLLDAGLITQEALSEALARQRSTGELIGEALVAVGAVRRDDVLRAVANQHALPYLSREELPIPIPVLKNLSPKYMRQYRFCPVTIEGA
ncbi:MAG: ATPase, partial [Candidatus Rokubacteria bacterium]|nr:ATPase [Candidatus Rokubacteria bacterium]